MVRHAKKLIEDKKLGNVEYINVEYVQDWSNGVKVTTKNAKKVFRWKLDKKITIHLLLRCQITLYDIFN